MPSIIRLTVDFHVEYVVFAVTRAVSTEAKALYPVCGREKESEVDSPGLREEAGSCQSQGLLPVTPHARSWSSVAGPVSPLFRTQLKHQPLGEARKETVPLTLGHSFTFSTASRGSDTSA